MFWSDTYYDRIYRSFLNGTGTTIILHTGGSAISMLTTYIGAK